ncbi:MAG TPA: HmuY family protein [Hanamia sp.]
MKNKKMKNVKISLLAAAVAVAGLVSCGKEEVPAPPPTPTVSVTDSVEIPFSSSKYLFYSFKDTAVVASSDSATTNWDFGLRFVSIIINSHSSGPGTGGAVSQPGIYNNYTTAPTTGYAYDTTATQPAIDASLNTGWYNYDENTHAFSPKAGQFFVIRTADNHYVKMEILSVTYAGFKPPNPTPDSLIYKFRYNYQADGTTNLQ